MLQINRGNVKNVVMVTEIGEFLSLERERESLSFHSICHIREI